MKVSAGMARLAFAGAMIVAVAAYPAEQQPWKGNAVGHDVAVEADGLIHIVFSGESSHLGRYSAEGQHYLLPGQRFAGTATFTAADGDELDVTYEGTLQGLEMIRTAGKMTIKGGTGRFKSAVGAATFDGFAPDGSFEFNFKGTLGKGK